MAEADDLATRFVDAAVAADAERLVSLLAADVHLRAVTPGDYHDAKGAADAAEVLIGWFRGLDARLVEMATETVGGKRRIDYLLGRATEGGDTYEMQQVAFVVPTANGDAIEAVDLLCSGWQRVAASAAALHTFDAGDMGCTGPLPRIFRERMADIPVGDRLEVLVQDPAAKADLPPLARMMGHTVLSTEDTDDGRVRIVVERGK